MILVTYRIETSGSIEAMADKIASDQSTGTFVPLPGETEELKARVAARVVAIRPLDDAAGPSWPEAADKGPVRRAEVDIAFPLDAVGTDLSALMTIAIGGIFSIRGVTGLRVVDLKLPEAFRGAYPGPQFGLSGSRALTGVHDRPIIGTIVKPALGLRPWETAELVSELVSSGVDFIKDDEKLMSPAYSPLKDRVAAIMPLILDHEQKTGKKVMYAFGISATDPDEMMRNHDLVLSAGGNCAVVNINSIGMGAMLFLRKRSGLVLHAHRNGWDLTRHPGIGLDFKVWQQFWRLLGVDQFQINGIKVKYWEPDESFVASFKAVSTPLFDASDCALPVAGSGQWGGQAPETYERTGRTTDLLYLCGGGIVSHPDGPAAGVRAVQQAWQAAVAGIALNIYAADHPELARIAEDIRRRIVTVTPDKPSPLLLSYYGDDFTGSTDVMEALAANGIETVLFLDTPDEALRQRFGHCRAIGIAGTSRSETPDWMDVHLPPIFAWLKAQKAAICHYKVCSTFDSAPAVGNIGKAIEIGSAMFAQDHVPVIVGAPQLKRYTVFGNLFAAYQGEIYRIDRHPVMSRHPVTPMREADLRLHLEAQTTLETSLVDRLTLLAADADLQVARMLQDRSGIVFFDVDDTLSQAAAGRQVWRQHRRDGLFVAGSSGMEYALLAEWRSAGLLPDKPVFDPPGPVERLAVVSGSVSPTTERQIRHATANGFVDIGLDPLTLLGETGASAIERAVTQALEALHLGRSVILHTALGPAADQGNALDRITNGRHRLGRILGEMLRRLIEEEELARAVIAGGDTSSHALSALQVQALTTRLPLPQTPGSPLCTAHGQNRATNGLQIALKGGQVGADDYFAQIREGRVS